MSKRPDSWSNMKLGLDKQRPKSYTGTVCGMILNPRLGPMAGNVEQ